MQIKIIKPGLLSTVQDFGRLKYRAQGVPVSGVMDYYSAHIANLAVGNGLENCATIEFTGSNASFLIEEDILMAYSGYAAKYYIDDTELPLNRPIFIPKGNIINLKHIDKGLRSYLAVAGAWKIENLLESASTCLVANFGGFNGRSLEANDLLNTSGILNETNLSILKTLSSKHVKWSNWSILNHDIEVNHTRINVILGPEAIQFTAQSLYDFFNEQFNISSKSNRMGYQIEGLPLNLKEKREMISSAVSFGTIQVNNQGNLILLMADAQTTGGYPRIAQVAKIDWPKCAHLKPNDKIYFEAMSIQEAQNLYLQQFQKLNLLQEAINQKYNP